MNLELINENSLVELQDFISNIEIKILKADFKLYKLNQKDYLPRYHKIRVSITNRSAHEINALILRIDRMGSKIGDDNYDTLPILTYDLLQNEIGKYDLFIFDPFNEKFEKFGVRLADHNDWQNRRKGDKQLEKAKDYSKRIYNISSTIKRLFKRK